MTTRTLITRALKISIRYTSKVKAAPHCSVTETCCQNTNKPTQTKRFFRPPFKPLENQPRKQAGVTLVELMIAMTAGTFLTLLILEYIISSTKIYNNQLASSRIEENTSFARYQLSHYIREAGIWKNSENFGVLQPFFLGACGDWDPCTSDGSDPASSDRIAIQTKLEDGVDCAQNSVPYQHRIANVFYTGVELQSCRKEDCVGSLFCRGFDITNNVWLGEGLAIIDGIDKLQVQYGLKPKAKKFTFFDANNVASAIDDDTGWKQVRSVRIAMLLVDPQQKNTQRKKERQYFLLDSPPLQFNDRLARSVKTSIISINNKLLQD